MQPGGRLHRDDGRHGEVHRFVDVLNQPLVKSNSYSSGKQTLGDAESHVHTLRITPLGNDVAFINNQSSRSAALFERPQPVGKGLGPKALIVRNFQIAGDRVVIGFGKLYRFLYFGGVQAQVSWLAGLPALPRVRIINSACFLGPKRRI